jgi:hypothetical protein
MAKEVILIVEDNDLLREGLREMLTLEDFTEQALPFLEKDLPPGVKRPLSIDYVKQIMPTYQSLIDKGAISEETALRLAMTHATQAMLPQIHNTALRNQFAQLARNFLPFYFAQEQALKRAFNSLKDTSVASPLFSRGMRFYQLAEHAMSDPTFMSTDENGNKFVNIPLVGAFGEGVQNALSAFGVPIVAGLPITVKGSTVSLK